MEGVLPVAMAVVSQRGPRAVWLAEGVGSGGRVAEEHQTVC